MKKYQMFLAVSAATLAGCATPHEAAEAVPPVAPATAAAAPMPAATPAISAPQTIAEAPATAPAVPAKSKIAALDRPAEPMRLEKAAIARALFAVGRTYGFTVIVAPDVTGNVTFETQSGTVRDLLKTITQSAGVYFEEDGQLVTVKKLKTILYYIEYPRVERKSSGSSSVSMSGGSNSGTSGGNGNYPGYANNTAQQTTLGGVGTNGALMNGSGTGSDQNSFQIQKENKPEFWSGIKAELENGLKKEDGETVTIETLSGIARVTAKPERHVEIKEYIDALNQRINQQVNISAEILEVTLNSTYQLGVDWQQVETKIGGGLSIQGLPGAGNIAAMTNTGQQALGATVAPGSFNAKVGFGKLTALISALKEQGAVRSKSNPTISTLTNQTAYIKVGEDDAFFSLSRSTGITAAGLASTTSTTTDDIYSLSTQTFGTILEVTPHVARSGLITMDVQPVITRLVSVERSPDLRQSAPNTAIKEAASIYQLYDGETGLLGGFIYDSSGTGSNGVPLLGDLPGIGKAFRTDSKTTQHTEVIILLTATLAKRRAQ